VGADHCLAWTKACLLLLLLLLLTLLCQAVLECWHSSVGMMLRTLQHTAMQWLCLQEGEVASAAQAAKAS
jgi:hypothetical protein